MGPFQSIWAQGGAVAAFGTFALAVLWAIVTGRLIPRRSAERQLELVAQRAELAERGRDIAERGRTAADERADATVRTLVEMTSALRSVESVMRDLSAQRGRDPG